MTFLSRQIRHLIHTCRTSITETYQSSSSGSAVAANGWGCEQITAASGTKYVATVTTALGTITTGALGDATITVLTQNINNAAAGAAGGTIRMTPCANSGATTFATCNAPTLGSAATIATWMCGPGASTPVLAKFLPGSCRGV